MTTTITIPLHSPVATDAITGQLTVSYEQGGALICAAYEGFYIPKSLLESKEFEEAYKFIKTEIHDTDTDLLKRKKQTQPI